MKLWTVKTDECIATYDHHEDKVMNKRTSFIPTGIVPFLSYNSLDPLPAGLGIGC